MRLGAAQLLVFAEKLKSGGVNPLDDKNFFFDRAMLIGQINILDLLSIDRTEFNWIFNL